MSAVLVTGGSGFVASYCILQLLADRPEERRRADRARARGRAAWDFVAKEGGVELTVINPVAVLGPVLGPDYSTSIMIVQRMMGGAVPGCPQRWFGIVDVRDVADLHVRAMTHPAARGERFLCTVRAPRRGDCLAGSPAPRKTRSLRAPKA